MAANEVLAVLMFASFIALVFSGFPVLCSAAGRDLQRSGHCAAG